MAKFQIESQITLLAVIIAAAVVTSGYFAWKSLSSIVSSIHEEALPDNRLFLLKDVATDLSAIENNVRLYMLTDNENNLESHDSLQLQINRKINELYESTQPLQEERELIDSFHVLAVSKVKLWNGVLNLHRNAANTDAGFSEMYEQLEQQQFDTLVTVTEKKSVFRRIFGSTKTIADTTIAERELETGKVREQIEELQQEIQKRNEQVNLLESNLIARNVLITRNINSLISEAEQNKTQRLLEETSEADRLAGITYQRLAGFSIAAVLLLLLVIFMLSNYVKKRRAYENGLQQARTEAENLAHAKEQFAANVSHEMRTPVNAIYGLAEQLLRRKNNENMDEQISVLAQSSHHLNQIINDTLDFTKVQTGKVRFDAVHFSPEQVFREIYALQKFSALQKGISLELEVDKNLSKALIGDPLRLKQILINLIGNAIKFTKKGKVVFHAKARETQNGKIDLQMQVSDTGIGIPKEDQQKVFEEFVQAENREGKKYRGTGLGLAIVKKLTELQNGTIGLESEPGTGTTVRLSIPYPKGSAEKIEKVETGLQEIPDFIKQLRVLVADDEEFNRFVLKSVFNRWNIRFKEAKNGEEAVQLAVSEDFDVVMMDVRMPKKNGIQATKEILNARPGTKIIAVTATENIQEKQQCIDAGVAAFLPKPFSEEQLFAAIHSSVNKPVIKEKQKKNEPLLAEFKKMAGGDHNFLKEMITLFIRSAENGLAEISAAIKKRNEQEIADAAHKIAPQCKQMRQMQLYSKLKELEKVAENEPADIQKMSNLFSQINDNIIAINRELRDYLKEMEKTG